MFQKDLSGRPSRNTELGRGSAEERPRDGERKGATPPNLKKLVNHRGTQGGEGSRIPTPGWAIGWMLIPWAEWGASLQGKMSVSVSWNSGANEIKLREGQ